jgi:hypothetical protein
MLFVSLLHKKYEYIVQHLKGAILLVDLTDIHILLLEYEC